MLLTMGNGEVMQNAKQQELTSNTPLPKRKRKLNARESQVHLDDCQSAESPLAKGCKRRC